MEDKRVKIIINIIIGIIFIILGFSLVTFDTTSDIRKALLQLSLVGGVVMLSMNDKEGWGWLIFILFCTV